MTRPVPEELRSYIGRYISIIDGKIVYATKEHTEIKKVTKRESQP